MHHTHKVWWYAPWMSWAIYRLKTNASSTTLNILHSETVQRSNQLTSLKPTGKIQSDNYMNIHTPSIYVLASMCSHFQSQLLDGITLCYKALLPRNHLTPQVLRLTNTPHPWLMNFPIIHVTPTHLYARVSIIQGFPIHQHIRANVQGVTRFKQCHLHLRWYTLSEQCGMHLLHCLKFHSTKWEHARLRVIGPC